MSLLGGKIFWIDFEQWISFIKLLLQYIFLVSFPGWKAYIEN